MTGFREEAIQLVAENGYKHIVEVGVWKGELSRMLYEVTDSLTLVDPWRVENNRFPEYCCRMNEPFKTQEELEQIYSDVTSAMPRARVLRMLSLEAAVLIPDGSMDFVYVDAVHVYSYIHADIIAWLPKVRSGGMIAGDDYNLTDVGRAVDELLGPQTFTEGQTGRTWYWKAQ